MQTLESIGITLFDLVGELYSRVMIVNWFDLVGELHSRVMIVNC